MFNRPIDWSTVRSLAAHMGDVRTVHMFLCLLSKETRGRFFVDDVTTCPLRRSELRISMYASSNSRDQHSSYKIQSNHNYLI